MTETMSSPPGPETTPFVHNWADAATRERYIFHARADFDNALEMAKHSQSAQLEYAKWILASLLAIHGGAIYAISNLRGSVPGIDQAALSYAAFLNVGGICFTIVTAMTAWFNFGAAEHMFRSWANPARIYRNDQHPAATRTDMITATYWLSICFAGTSLYLFVASAAELSQVLSAHALRPG